MKRRMIMLLLLAFAVALTGCGSNGANAPSGGSNGASGGEKSGNAAKNAQGETKEPVKIKFYTYKANKPEEPFVQAVNAFNAMQDEIEVEYVDLVQNNDAVEFANKLDVLLASGEKVDVVHTANMDQVVARAARGVFEPLDDYFKRAGIAPADEYVLNPVLDGKTYGMIATSSQFLVAFNKDILEKSGLPLPQMGWTWNEFREYAKKMTTADHYGSYFHTWGEYPNVIAYTELPHPQLKEDMTLQFDHPSYKYFFELRRAMEKEDKSVQPYEEILASKNHILQPFFEGKVGMIPVGSFIVRAGTLLDKFPHEFQMVYAPIPRSPEQTELGLTNISGSFLAMGANSEAKDAAYTFMRWLSTEGATHLKDIPGWKKADGKQLLGEFFGEHANLIDIDSLSNVLFHSETKMLPTTVAVPYGSELKTVVENGFTKYMLDNTTFEEAQTYLIEESQKIIDQIGRAHV